MDMTLDTAVKPSARLVLLVALAVVATAIALVWSIYQTRSMTSQLQRLKAEQNSLNVEWGRLQLEASTWGGYPRVEKMAHEQLKMSRPDASRRIVVTP